MTYVDVSTFCFWFFFLDVRGFCACEREEKGGFLKIREEGKAKKKKKRKKKEEGRKQSE